MFCQSYRGEDSLGSLAYSQRMSTYSAEIRRTTHGVAHIRAETLGSVAFGQGYACAADHLPTLADQILKVRSERARFFGRGENDCHINSDFGYLALGVREWGQRMLDTQPTEILELVSGYAAGVNRWLAENGTDSLPQWCRSADWIRPVSPLDLFTLYADVALMASGRNVVEMVGAAQPPDAEPVVGPAADQPIIPPDHPGSNGWGFGSEVTANGRGMVVANPHFPWRGDGRFWECHLTVPGELDVYGVSLIGTPLVQMGFNRHVAWTHTFSAGHRFCFFQIHPGSGPSSYRFGEETREMTSQAHRISVLDNGELSHLDRVLWRTHHGPMLDVPFLGWSAAGGFALGDSNDGNDRFLGQYLAINRATSVDELRTAVHQKQGLPWTNTVAADDHGEVWYADAATTPLLSEETGRRFEKAVDEDLVTALLFSQRVALLDGSDPASEWVGADGAPQPGRAPIGMLPELRTTRTAFNSNDPYWVPSPDERLDPAPTLCGLHGRALSPRTRMNATILAGRAPSGPSADGWTSEDAEAALLDNASLLAELLIDEVVRRATGVAVVTVDGREVELAEAVQLLTNWDRRFDLNSVGAIIWREFLASFPEAELRNGGSLWAEPFDPQRAIETPSGLHPAPLGGGHDPILTALGRAVLVLEAAEIAIDSPLGSVQFVERSGQRVPLHGANEVEGIANVVAPIGNFARSDLEPLEAEELPLIAGRTERTGIRRGGYSVTYGASFVAVMGFDERGPVAKGLLVYGQSGDSRSPHHVDQVEAFSSKSLRPMHFHDEDIAADPHCVSVTVTGSTD